MTNPYESPPADSVLNHQQSKHKNFIKYCMMCFFIVMFMVGISLFSLAMPGENRFSGAGAMMFPELDYTESEGDS